MAIKVSNDSDYRRGVILGLTMAEVLILLLFLLLLFLAANWKSSEIQKQLLKDENLSLNSKNLKLNEEVVKYKRLELDRPILSQLSAEELSTLLEASDHLNSSEAENEKLRSELAEYNEIKLSVSRLEGIDPTEPPASILKKGLKALQVIGVRLSDSDFALSLVEIQTLKEFENIAHKINPNEPPSSVLKKALDDFSRKMATSLNADQKSDGQIISDLQNSLIDYQKKLEILKNERDLYYRQTQSLIRQSQGNGLTMPPCWPDENNKPQFIYSIEITDSGVIVTNVAPVDRKDDPVWDKIDTFKIGEEISVEDFHNSTLRLRKYSDEKTCRHYVKIYDRTSSTNKLQWQKALALVESNFYKLLLKNR